MPNALKEFLYPNSIAVIGASKDPTKRGFRAIQTLLAEPFAGSIFPINPKEKEILGLTAYPDIQAVPNRIDLALICTPAKTLPDIIEACGQKGVKGAVILAGGFSETGADGAQLEDKMLAVARQYGVRLIGPNTSGLFNTHKGCNLVGFEALQKGEIGILSQSGNMALALATEAQAHGQMGFSTYIGVGNEADIQFHEYLEFFGEDDNTRALAIYVEGLKQGRAFFETARRVTPIMPLVLYKSGRTAIGRRAAKSHTGALAGDYALSRDVLQQAGVTVVDKADQILPVAETLAALPLPAGNRLAILADGGGHATIAADAVTERGLVLATLAEETRAKLAAKLPPAATLTNPVDLAGGADANPEVFADCARALLQDDNVDALLIVGLFGGYKLRFSPTLELLENQTAARLGNLLIEFDKPLILHSIYAPHKPDALLALRAAGVPVHGSIETSAQCLASLVQYSLAQYRLETAETVQTAAALPAATAILADCRQVGRNSLLEYEARELLKTYGVTVPPLQVVREPAALADASQGLGDGPLAMKVVSKDILHKSDAGGVRLNVRGAEALQQAFAEIMTNSRNYDSAAAIEGVLLTPMAKPGVETIIGVTRDPQFGLVMMFGLGGIFVEVFKDVTFRALPLSAADAAAMLAAIKAQAMLDGVRGLPPVDRQALVELLLQISRLCMAHPEITEVDLNPVLAYPDGYAIVDARVILAD